MGKRHEHEWVAVGKRWSLCGEPGCTRVRVMLDVGPQQGSINVSKTVEVEMDGYITYEGERYDR